MSSEPNELDNISQSVRPSVQHPLHTHEGGGGELCPLEDDGTDAVAIENGMDEEDEPKENAKPKILRSPTEPTKREREEHALTHVPFRDWCAHCVRGRGISSPHPRSSERSEDSVPLIAGDYGFPGDKRDESGQRATVAESITLLCLADSRSGSKKAMVVPRKGAADQWIARRVATWINSLGYNKVRLRVDPERSMQSLAEEVKIQRGGRMETILENAPQGEKQSNGLAERAVRTGKDMLRTLKGALEDRIKCIIPPKANVLKWMAERGSVMRNRYSIGPDGKTPYERVTGRKPSSSLCEFAERVLYMPTKAGRGGDLEMKFFYGTFVGIHGPSDEKIVATSEGALRVRTIRRLPEAERWVKEDVLNIPCSPAAPIDGVKEEPVPAVLHADVPRRPAEPAEFPLNRRRMKITKADLLQHGYTPRCPGCTLHRASSRLIPRNNKMTTKTWQRRSRTANGEDLSTSWKSAIIGKRSQKSTLPIVSERLRIDITFNLLGHLT